MSRKFDFNRPETVFLRDTEAAELLGLAPQTLRNLRCQGGGPAYVVLGNRRSIRYTPADLEAWAMKGRVESGD